MQQRKTIVLISSLVVGLMLFGGMSPMVYAKEKASKNPKQYKVVVSGVLSRSGLPTDKQLVRLRETNGVVGLVNLLPANEPGGEGNVRNLPSFGRLGFRYLSLPIQGSFPPTTAQANQFLTFVKRAGNQPAHVFCKAGNARTGTMVALYRYSVQGWSMEQAIRESKKFGGGPSAKQLAWLKTWATTHAPGAY